MKNTIGLFGTCGGSDWRVPFIEKYEAQSIDYFNPDAGDHWHPGLVDEENLNLREDRIILFPVLAETSGLGSLAEIGFSIMNVVRNIMNGSEQMLVILIDDDCIVEDQAVRKESIRSRKLVKSKVEDIRHPNIYMVENMEQMFELSIKLHELRNTKEEIDSMFKVS